MSLKDEILEYTQPDGLISPDHNPTPDSTGNGLLYLSLYYILLVRRGEARPDDFNNFIRVVRSCESNKINGLYNRSPTKIGDQEGPDDYIGVSTASFMMKAPFAKEILAYGYQTRFFTFSYIYNNVEPGKYTDSAWFGRMPHVIAHFYFCADIIPNIIFRKLWVANLTFSALFKIKDANSCLLNWLLCEVLNGRSFICTMAIAFWENRLRKTWENGFKSVLEKHLSKDHPIVKYWI